MQKSQKKKEEKKFFLKDGFPCGIPISGDKKGGKRKWFCLFSVRGEGKCEINLKKKKNFFSPLRSFFNIFGF